MARRITDSVHPAPAVPFAPLTPLSFLKRAARVFPDKTAVIDGDERITYADLAREALAVAQALRSAGVQSGDRVAYLMPNTPRMLVGHFAVPLAEAVLVAINTRLAAEEIAYILGHCGASVLVVDNELFALASKAAERVTGLKVLVSVPSGKETHVDERHKFNHPDPVDYWEFLASVRPHQLAWSPTDENAPIAINYTSGTTGKPKGVVYTHRGAYLNALGEVIHSGFTSASRYLWTLPMFHCNGWCTAWAVTAVGGTHLCLRSVRAETIWRLIRAEKVSHLNAAPTVLTTISNATEAGHLEHPVTITTAGAPPSPATLLEMTSLGFRIVHVYGLTETYGPYSICEEQSHWQDLSPQRRAAAQARQGVSMIQAEGLRVVDQNMHDVTADGLTIGEIVMRGNNVMAGYYRDPEATAEAFRGGWFHSGDLGVMHPDGYVELRDRAKDIIISGGENISTVQVEQALMSHEAVLEVAVVGVPDAQWGERPKAFVVLKAGAAAPTVDALIEHVRQQIAHYKAPRDIEFRTGLPKTTTGKIQKFALRD